MKGDAVERLPVLTGKLEHLRVAEIRDTLHPRREHAVDAARLAEFNVRAALVCGLSLNGRVNGFIALFSSQPRKEGWDANLHLMLKLVGSSFATGLERLRVQRYLARLEERNALSLPAANDGMWDFDVENNTVYYSPRWRKMLGYDEHDADVTPDWRRLVHPDDLARVQAMIRDHIAGKTPMFESVHRMRHVKGDWRWVVSRAQARVDASGRLRRLVCVEFDITERKLYEDALFKEKESAQITLQSIGDGVITTDGHMIVEYLNPTAEELTGWKFEEAQGKGIDEIFRGFHEETCEPLENPLSVAIRRARAIKSVRPTLLIKRDGNEMYIESTASPIRDGSGAVCGGVLVFHDVSESRELNRKLSYHASHDILTGLVNRREFEARLERSLRSAKARETQYALCHLDVDQFKIINDTCGHSAGDALLGQVGALLKTKIRWRDTLARLGGDEFGVLLESCSLDDALVMAEQLRETMRNYKFVWEERTFRLGCSIGVVPITGDSEDVATVLSSADSACQAAKEGGRNRVFSFQDNDIDLMRRRREMQWAARINNALEESRFELFRMTIQPLQKHEPGAHYELLLRMRDETGKIVSPDNFINAAERYGITPQIDRWVVEHALRWLVSEADERERLALCSINLSGQSLGDAEFLPFVQKLLKNSGIDGTEDLLRDHGDGGDRQFLAGQPLHRGPQGRAGLQVRARRLRHGPVVVRLPEALPRRLPEDRRQLRQGNPARPDRPGNGAVDQRDRSPDGQADDRGVRRERRDHQHAAVARRRLRAGLRHLGADAHPQDCGERLRAVCVWRVLRLMHFPVEENAQAEPTGLSRPWSFRRAERQTRSPKRPRTRQLLGGA